MLLANARPVETSLSAPHLVFVGGFLGAGKTTLILAAARELARRGVRSAVILNDQGDALVDTSLAQTAGVPAGEVTGGCFCCRFSELIEAAEALRVHAPEVIFAEPVGSCTDISATLLRPIEETFRDAFRLAPFSVLADPLRARELLAADANPHMAFLFRKQLQEADLVCWTKSDLHPELPELAGMPARKLSARTGQGVAAWLDEVLSGRIAAGQTLLEIDYNEYARAEAALAWLNAELVIESVPPRSPAMVLGPLIDRLDQELSAAGIGIVHLKATDHAPSGFLKAAICGGGQEPEVEGALDASPCARHHLLLNLRAAGAPDPVRAIVDRVLAGVAGSMTELRLTCFSPAAPRPERRVTR